MTGNTEKVANAIKEALSGEDVTLVKAENVDPSSLKAYDLAFIGSGTYAGTTGKSVKTLLKDVEELPANIALFYTHASENPGLHGMTLKKVKKMLSKKGCTACAEFDCRGEPKDAGAAQRQKMMLESLPPEKRKELEEANKRLKGHPNAEDLENAKSFAVSIMKSLK